MKSITIPIRILHLEAHVRSHAHALHGKVGRGRRIKLPLGHEDACGQWRKQEASI